MKNLLPLITIIVMSFILYSTMPIHAGEYQVLSPDKGIKLTVNMDEKLSFSVFYNKNENIA